MADLGQKLTNVLQAFDSDLPTRPRREQPPTLQGS